MSGEHARPTSVLFRSAPGPKAAPQGAKHGRHTGRGRWLRRRILAYRDIQFLSTHVPGDTGPREERLLLVHGRKVVGQVHYRLCTACGTGVITGVDMEEHLHSTGLGTRALSHLRSRYPSISWRSTLTLRTTRELLRRMGIPTTSADTTCAHADARQDPVRPAG
ncbi:hypothetical protein [Streptomyces albidochromogenes]|uniref:N-acetyltransferase n=1 Tax=Streptomyces albidochromogenes TaxID=329524 RepID=A0ABW6FNZ8_9ACTN